MKRSDCADIDWAGIDAEVWGMQKAWRNLRGDSAAMASYVYDRMSAYHGPGHPGVCCILLQRLVEAAVVTMDNKNPIPFRQFEAHLESGKRSRIVSTKTAAGWVAASPGFPTTGPRSTAQRASNDLESLMQDRERWDIADAEAKAPS